MECSGAFGYGVERHGLERHWTRLKKCINVAGVEFFFYAPNFGEVEGAYWFWPVRPYVCTSVRPSVCLSVTLGS